MNTLKRTAFYTILFPILLSLACSSTKTETPPQTPTITSSTQPQAPQQTNLTELETPQMDPELQKIQENLNSQPEQTLQEIHNYLLQHPKNIFAFELNAQALLALNKPQLAILSLQKALEIESDNTRLKKLLSLAYVQNNDIALAKEQLETLNQQHPNDPDTLLLLAQLSIMNLDYDNAHKYASQAYKLNSFQNDFLYFYAETLYAINDADKTDEMIKLYQTLSDTTNDQTRLTHILQRLATIYEIKKSDPDNACKIYTLLHQKHPSNPNYKASKDFNCKQNN